MLPEIKIIGKERNSNLELYRIIVMIMIVAHHYVVNSGLWSVLENTELNVNSYFLYLFGMWGKTGINCFVLITGYFMCKSHATIQKFLKLLFEVMFYKIIIYFLFVMVGIINFDLLSCYKAFLPISNVGDGFMTGFLLFYLFIPFLNILIKNLNKAMHLKLIMLSLFIYTLWDLFPTITITFNYVTWFIILYFISSYIRLYPNDKYDSNTKMWGILSIILIFIAMLSVYIRVKYRIENVYRFVSDSNAVLSILIGITTFMFFKNVNIRQSKFINTISATMLGVLLIHANSDAMRQWLWKYIFDNIHYFYTHYCVLHALISVSLTFIICVIVDYFRIRFIEKPFFKSYVYKEILNKLEKVIN